MTKRILMFAFAAVLTLAPVGQAFAQGQSKDETAINDKNAATGQALAMLVPQQCFSSGSTFTFLKICITNNGNISWFESPAGYVHLQTREGYAVCSSSGSVVHGYDVNIAANGWGTPTIAHPNGAGTFPLIITRQSLDGVIQLTQTFTRNTGERGVDVEIDVKNMSLSALQQVYVTRYFDGDIDNTSKNAYVQLYRSVWARATINGVTLTQATSNNVVSVGGVYDYAEWDPFGPLDQVARGCGGGHTANTGNVADFVGQLLSFFSNLNAGQTKTITLQYRRF